MRLLLASLLALVLLPRPAAAGDHVYLGSERDLAVRTPRAETAEVRIDGDLSEPAWAEAAVLSGFTQFEPVEGRPASERTEVLVFYTPSALYVGVRAYARDPGSIRATLARRDQITRDDHVRILLDTFLDRRRAYAFYVNPLGIQQDGIVSEGSGGTSFSPDFLFDSRGRLTPEGYEVEVRIPFRSLRFPAGESRGWGINVVRKIAATGAEESWAPLSRGNPSRLAQSGTLVGVRELRPGRLLEVNPTATARREGTADGSGGLRHGEPVPGFGMNARYGLTSNLVLDATVNPDFSQVEADAGQITVNERFAISLPEKRPFFLEGAEVFSTPEPLVYTRSIADPAAGAKVTGKVGSFSLGYLGAVDESPRALFNIARVQRDMGAGSSLGALLTDRTTDAGFNRVAGVDGRVRFGGVYTGVFQAAGSWTRDPAPASAGADGEPLPAYTRDRAGHLLHASLDRTGRRWGFLLRLKDVPEDFRSESGFIRRTGVTDLSFHNRLTFYGAPGSLVESWGPRVSARRVYEGRGLWRGGDAAEGSAALRLELSLRGNNHLEAGVSERFYTLDPARYAGYSLVDASGAVRTGEELVAPLMAGLRGFSLEGRSSYFRALSANAEARWEETPIFAEGTRGEEWSAQGGVELRPMAALRVDGSVRHSRIFRAEDGSLYSQAVIPRLRAEYQITRAVFVRAVGQYSVEEVDLLRAPGGEPYLRGGEPFRLRRGQEISPEAVQANPLRLDLLFSYQPSPGTVVFLGYGREVRDDGAYRLHAPEPRSDGLFVKLSYLFRS